MGKRVSIAMAVYNGEKYIREQIDSILGQLNSNDELIISYDESTDGTWNIINEYASKDERIIVMRNPQRGVVSNFQNALSKCSGQFIFYSDQDDVWMPEKVETVLEKFKNPKVTVVIHDATLVDSQLDVIADSTFAIRNGNTSLVRNFIRLSYIGCALAFRAEMLPIVMPLPTKKRSHDWWTGTICSCLGKMDIIHTPLIMHRIHDDNATPKKRPPITYQLEVRWLIMSNAMLRCFKYRRLLFRKLKGIPVIKQDIN